MNYTSAKFVTLLLAFDQKQQCLDVCLEFCEMTNNNPTFISRIIKSNEAWVTFFPQNKMKLAQHCYDTTDEIQMELQAVLDSLQENLFCRVSEAWSRLLYAFQKEGNSYQI